MTDQAQAQTTPESAWKTITVPKGVYLPTQAANGVFKDSGLKVEPTDKIEILPNSNQIRVNGVEYQLFISTSSLRLGANNCLILDRPQPPVADLASGDGKSRARVGRVGTTRAYVASLQEDGPPEGMHLDQNMEAVAPNSEPAGIGFGKGKKMPDIDLTTFAETAVVEEVTLKDGTKAFVYIDPETGRPCSAPFRTYGGIGTDPEEALRLMREQEADAQVVPGPAPQPRTSLSEGFYRLPDVAATAATHPMPPLTPRAPPHAASAAAQQPPPPPKTASSGNANLDGFIGLATKSGSQGFTLGTVSHVAAPDQVLDALTPAGASVCTSIEAAFARIHLSPAPIVYIRLPANLTDGLRLQLAEQLPTLSEVARKHGQTAIVILTPLWAPMPSLLSFICPLALSFVRHPTDERFATVTCIKGSPTPGSQPIATFPV